MIAHRDTPRPDGERRKTRALSLLAKRREVYVNRGRRALLTRLLETGSATIDAVRDEVELPAVVNPVCFGVVPGVLAKANIIRGDGYTESLRPRAHARPVKIWCLTDRLAALDWLRDHPDEADPEPAQSDLTLFDLTIDQEKPPAATGGQYGRTSTDGPKIPQ